MLTSSANDDNGNGEEEEREKGKEGQFEIYDLFDITIAYDNKEINFEEWIKQSREWALSVVEKSGE